MKFFFKFHTFLGRGRVWIKTVKVHWFFLFRIRPSLSIQSMGKCVKYTHSRICLQAKKQWYWRNNERRPDQSSVVSFWQELHNCGWFWCYLKNIHLDQLNKARGQSWPQRSELITTLSKWYCIISMGHSQYLGTHPWPKI